MPQRHHSSHTFMPEQKTQGQQQIQQLLQQQRIEICNMIDGLLHCVAIEISRDACGCVCVFCFHTQTKDCRGWKYGQQSFDLELVANIHFIYNLGLCAAEWKCKNAVSVVILHKLLFFKLYFFKECYLFVFIYVPQFSGGFVSLHLTNWKMCVFFFWPLKCTPVTYSFHMLPG